MRQYVESYRHLREHANAFSIILMEIVLAFVLASLPGRMWAVLVLVWIAPASFCWLLGTELEAKLTEPEWLKSFPTEPPSATGEVDRSVGDT
jgi:hypothetical protein